MSNWTIGNGALMTALGVGGYLATGAQSKTALIPAGFGVAVVGLGLLARRESRRKAALGGALALGLLALAGSARGVSKLPALVSGEPLERPAAVVSQSLLAGLAVAQVVIAARGLKR